MVIKVGFFDNSKVNRVDEVCACYGEAPIGVCGGGDDFWGRTPSGYGVLTGGVMDIGVCGRGYEFWD